VRFATRLAVTFAALDLTFKLLVGLAFFQVMGARPGLLQTTVMICGPVWVIWLGVVWWLARPVELAAEPSAAELQRAGERCAKLPTWLAAIWTVQWAGAFSAVIAIEGGFDLASSLFIIALILGPVPLAHAMVLWLSAPDTRRIELAASDRGIMLVLPRSTIGRRLLLYAFSLVIAPSAYMAAIGVAARIHATSSDALVIAIGIGFAAVAVYAVLTSLLITTALTRPIVEMSDVVRVIAEHGTVARVGQIPRYQHDELGVLVSLTNEMVRRLEHTERGRTEAVTKLEQLARTLELRVEKREHELALARRIQTSILPQTWNVDELDIAATMVTATEVGGDYYDILPRPRGGWIAIGDVSGHGVSAGLIMLMLQCITASLVDAFPNASASELVVAINRVLFTNIRHRLGAKDFVTFTLVRYEGGRLRYAGAHEELVVWRAKTRTCERHATPGPWIGAISNLEKVMVETELALESGDLLVLYTDGIIEAPAADKQRYGMDRLCSTIESLAHEPVDRIASGVVESALQFCARQEDDMSIVVARQR
jgi:serine phosphatase RsbU (regulator of sigma subunit)